MVPRRSNTRERLVATATSLFWRDGYASTGVTSIIQQAGATSGSFYHFFSTKEDLLLAVLDRFEDRLLEAVRLAAADRSESSLQRVMSLFALHRQQFERNKFNFGLSLAPLATGLGDDQTRVRERIAAIFSRWRRCIETDLLVGDGSVNPEEADLAGFVQAVLEGTALQARVARNSEPFVTNERVLRRYLEPGDERFTDEDQPPTETPLQTVPTDRGTEGKDWRAW